MQLTVSQVLGMTGDNTTSNNTMINELEVHLESFGGACNHRHCFDHVVNLCVKFVLKLFDVE